MMDGCFSSLDASAQVWETLSSNADPIPLIASSGVESSVFQQQPAHAALSMTSLGGATAEESGIAVRDALRDQLRGKLFLGHHGNDAAPR